MEPLGSKNIHRTNRNENFRRSCSYFKARRAEYSDIAVLQALLEEDCNKETFGNQIVGQLIENSLISVTVIEQTKHFERITGYASFNDIPSHVLPDLANWPDILQRSLSSRYFSTANSMFLTSLITEPKNTEKVLEECLKILFIMNPELDFCLLLTFEEPDSIYENYFPAWMEFASEDQNFFLGICKKESVWPEILIREAHSMDVPKILPYFEELHEKLQVNLGKDWLEKIIRTAPSSKDTKCCVVEDPKGQICGFFSVTSTNIDWDYLNTHYQTNIFHQFIRITDNDRIDNRFSNCDVELGSSDPEADHVHEHRTSVESDTYLNNRKEASNKDKQLCHNRKPADDLTLTPSVEWYIANLIDNLSCITNSNSDVTTNRPEPSSDTPLELNEDREDSITNDLPAEVEPWISDNHRTMRETSSTTEAYLLSAKSIINQLLDTTLQSSDPTGTSESSIDHQNESQQTPTYTSQILVQPSVENNTLKLRRQIVSVYSDKLEKVLSQLHSSTLTQNDPARTETNNYHSETLDVLQDLLSLLEDNAVKILKLETMSSSSTNLGGISQITLHAVKSLLSDIEKDAEFQLNVEYQAEQLVKVPSVTQKLEIETESLRQIELSAWNGKDEEELKSSQISTVKSLVIPVVNLEALATLKLLIHQLEEENKEISREDFRLHKLQTRPTSQQFNISCFPTEFQVDVLTSAPGEYQLQRTNVVGLYPASLKERVQNRNGRDDSDVNSNFFHQTAVTTARLSDLAFGVKDLMSRMSFAVKKADASAHDSESLLSTESGTDRGRVQREKKKHLPSIDVEEQDQILKRNFKREYGLHHSATEPMFNSWDDLLKVPQPFIANITQEPGTRAFQRKANKFFQNPILGRSGEFAYITTNGEQNGMYLLLFHLDEFHITYLDKILAHCYKVLPGFDYILTQIPTSAHYSMLLTKFMRASLRTGHFLREDLFVFHISSLLRCENLEFAAGILSDIQPVSKFLNGKPDSSVLLLAFTDAVHFHTNHEAVKLNCQVIRISGVIVGFVIFTQESDIDYLLAHYSLDDFLCSSQHREYGHLRILHYIINPMLNWMNQFVMQEIMRLLGASSFFYKFYPLERQLERKDSFPCCLDQMNLIRPRSVLQFPKSANWKLLPSSVAREQQDPFALYHTNRRLLYDKRAAATDRIIIVGASDTSIQVLRNLILFPHIRFTNIILIDPYGVAALDQANTDEEHTFVSARHLFSVRELQQLAIPAHCQILYGKAVTMNKSLRILHVNDKLRIPFDYMVIGTGTQFLPFNINCDTDWISNLVSGDSEQQITDAPRKTLQQTHPHIDNYFVINNAYEADSVTSKIEELMETPECEGYYLIYGNSLEAYGCLRNLLEMGIQPEEILFVNPAPAFPESQPVFSSIDFEVWVNNMLFTNGIVLIMEWIVVAYNEGEGGDTINTVTFWTDEAKFKTFHVRAFFNYVDRQMDPLTYSFLNSSYLVLDKKLVTDEKFFAFPPRILAGGSWCKYPRKYFSGNFDFENVNTREIGDMISLVLLKGVCPEMFEKTMEKDKVDVDVEDLESSDNFPTLPKFRKPLIDSISLPFGWYYCNIHSPQSPIAGTFTESGEEQLNLGKKDERRLFRTGSMEEGNLFEIHLDKLRLIDQIICVTKFPLQVHSLVILHGMHESWLELVQRFKDGYIKNFFEYIQELWLSCVFYDRFPMLEGELRRLLLDDQGDGKRLSVIEIISHCFKNQESPKSPQNLSYEEVMRRIHLTGVRFVIAETIENFLENNNRFLPMYASKSNQGVSKLENSLLVPFLP